MDRATLEQRLHEAAEGIFSMVLAAVKDRREYIVRAMEPRKWDLTPADVERRILLYTYYLIRDKLNGKPTQGVPDPKPTAEPQIAAALGRIEDTLDKIRVLIFLATNK